MIYAVLDHCLSLTLIARACRIGPRGPPFVPTGCRSRDHGKDPLTAGSEARAGSNVRACVKLERAVPGGAIRGRPLRRRALSVG